MFSNMRFRMKYLAAAAAIMMSPVTGAEAKTISFNADPFAGSTALTTPGRQIVGNELFIPDFDIMNDVLEFDPTVFGLNRPLSFASGSAASFAGSVANFLMLQDVDADFNPANGILNNAGTSANNIAASGINSGPGFFVYFNSALDLNRLVYSTNLASPTADLKVLARFTNQAGANAAPARAAFSARNIAAVPEPATWMTLILGFGIVGFAMRSKWLKLLDLQMAI
jgi:hypothetical protein